jgi:glycosyltransferase involved in cell wall biosynthesis
MLLLERGLKRLGVDVITLYYNKRNLGELIKWNLLPILGDKHGYRRKLWWKINYLRRHIPKAYMIDIIHAHDVLSMISVAEEKQKKVLTLHGYFSKENIEFIKNKKVREELYPYLLQLEEEGVNNADYVITVDKRLKEYIISEFDYPADRIAVVHNAVDTDLFRPISEEKQRKLKKMFGFAEEDIIILVPRRLVEKNGVIYGVLSMKYIKNKKLKMIIAGDGPEKSRIAKEAKGDNRIHFIGSIPHKDIFQYYMMADIILIPSITSHEVQEATSLAMLEGMASGKVVICSNIGGMREIVKHMENGILVNEKDPEEIARAIEIMLNNKNLMDKIGENARNYVVKNHSFLAHAQKILNIYTKLLEEER